MGFSVGDANYLMPVVFVIFGKKHDRVHGCLVYAIWRFVLVLVARSVGVIHGRLLIAWSTAGVLGPFAITYLRNISRESAIADLASKVDASIFAAKFGAPLSQLQTFVEAKTVTIAKLLEIAPAGTIDPTPNSYNSTTYCHGNLVGDSLFLI